MGVMTRTAAVAIAAASLLLLPSAARADGLPVAGWSQTGVVLGQQRYLAIQAGHGTVLERVNVRGGQPQRTRYLHRLLGIQAVAADGTGGGISRDGSTLVLTPLRNNFPQRTSTLYLFEPQRLTPRAKLTLKGDFSFDAISPDGATIYLIQLNPRDPTRYAVRAVDVASGRLVPKPVVDPREPGEVMRGYPLTRVSSPDGRFAYTLYSGSEKPFVHALDTVHGIAACLDLPPIADYSNVSLRLRGRRLAVLSSGAAVSYVDTLTRKVTPARLRSGSAEQTSGGDAPPLWALLGGAAAVALGTAAAVGARRRRAGALRS
jgi:hypothetical protein